MIKPRALKKGDTVRSGSNIRANNRRGKSRNRKVSRTYGKSKSLNLITASTCSSSGSSSKYLLKNLVFSSLNARSNIFSLAGSLFI